MIPLGSSQPADYGALSGYMEEVELRTIHHPTHMSRTNLDPLDELTSSVMEKGLLEPIVVRPTGSGFEVVAGNRRLEACRRLRFRKIPCHVVELDDKEAYEVSLVENLHRKTLNPLEEGLAFRRYVNDYGYGGVSELAKKIGKSHTYVSRRIGLLSLPESLQGEIVRRRTSASVANELLSLDDKSREEIADFIIEQQVTNRAEVRRLVKRMRFKDRGDDYELGPSSPYELREINRHMTDRTLAKCISSLKEDMSRFDDAMDSLDDEQTESWVVKESLTHQRRRMNNQVDDLLRLRKKFRHAFGL